MRISLLIALACAYGRVEGGRVDCDPPIGLDPANAADYCTEMAQAGKLLPGTVCLLRPEHVHPTQAAIGKAAMHCTKRRLEKMNGHELLNFKLENLVPTFVGPDKRMYISDKHHMSTALFEAELRFEDHMLHRASYACIQEDFSELDAKAFWTYMNSTGNCYPYGHYGQAVDFSEIPSSLKKLKDDPYRTYARYVRTSRAFVKCGGRKTAHLPQCQGGSAPFFIEFKWAEFLRDQLPPIPDIAKPPIRPFSKHYIYETNYQSQIDALRAALPQAMRTTMSAAASHMPGFNSHPELYKPSLADIDEYGCDNDTSQ